MILACIRCDKKQSFVHDKYSHVSPYTATVFKAHNDSYIHGTSLEMTVCDGCLQNAANKNQIVISEYEDPMPVYREWHGDEG